MFNLTIYIVTVYIVGFLMTLAGPTHFGANLAIKASLAWDLVLNVLTSPVVIFGLTFLGTSHVIFHCAQERVLPCKDIIWGVVWRHFLVPKPFQRTLEISP